jgi:TolB protein
MRRVFGGGASMKTRLGMAFLAAVIATAAALSGVSMRAQQSGAVGTFENSGDVGMVLHPGAVTYQPKSHNYSLTASGENIWSTQDAFQFGWKKMSGDVSFAADVSFVGKGVNPHRKAVLMIRQSLDADSPYVDAALHGSGLLALQYRETKGGSTTEIETAAPIYKDDMPLNFVQSEPHTQDVVTGATTPIRLRIVKRDGYVYLYMALKPGSPVEPAGAAIPMPFVGPFYIGIGLSSHDKDAVERAVFTNVVLTPIAARAETPTEKNSTLYSTLETVAIDSTIRHIYTVEKARFEAPNWTRDAAQFLLNRDGRIWRFPAAIPDPVAAGAQPVASPEPVVIDTGFATRCNNDHGISPDGTQLVISDNSQETHDSLVYTLPVDGLKGGGAPKRITKNSPSYWHGWSPDGSTLAFVGQRNGDFDIYTLPATAASSADEKQLTTAKGLDDGPEYTPDGKWIYFNSERSGHMQIWRMHPDGSAQEQVTHDDWNNWFPHFSPDGKWMVMLSYDKSVAGHPENRDVQLRLMSMSDGKITVLARLFGGQGTINVPSWAPDSKHLAFVSYELLPE